MINQNKVNEIKKMLKEGFSSKLISFELEIPLEEVKIIEKELQAENQSKVDQPQEAKTGKTPIPEVTTRTEQKNIHSKLKQTKFSKMQILRDRYYELYSPKKEEEKENKEVSRKTSRILSGEEAIYNPNTPVKSKKKAIIAFAQDLSRILEQAQDLEEVKSLQKVITPEMERIAPFTITTLKNGFDAKIRILQSKNTIENIKNNIPPSIMQVIASLANNEIDMQVANEIIDAEAKRRVESKPKTRFSLTEEQERRQILYQIQATLSENAEKYPIRKPEIAIAKIKELCGVQKGAALRVVVLNLTGKKHFETARILCNKFTVENSEPDIQRIVKSLFLEIRDAEIADFVLKGIRMNASIEEENTYYELLESGLRKVNINPRAISLGKTQDGTKNITLADILTDGKQKQGTVERI